MYYYKIYGQSVISDLEMSILQKTEPTDCAEDQAIYVMLGSMPAPYDQMPGKSYHYSSDIGFLSNDGCNLLILNGKKITVIWEEKTGRFVSVVHFFVKA